MPVSLCPGGEGGEEGEDGDGSQGPPFGPVKPALHLHALLPSSESMLAAQAEHDEEPAVFPDGHGAQVSDDLAPVAGE